MPSPSSPDGGESWLRGLLAESPDAGAAGPREGVSIDLGLFGLDDLLGVLGRSTPAGVVDVVADGLSGAVHLVGGGQAICWAGGLRGLDAALALLDVDAGTLRFRREAGETPQGEAFVIEDALLQQAWIRDELSRRNGSVPADAELIVTGPAPTRPVAADDAGLPLRGLRDVVAAAAPITVTDLLRLELCAPQRLRLALTRLIAGGQLARSGVSAGDSAATP